MSDSVPFRVELLKVALDSYREEYKEVWETWRSLDAKAQGSGAIAGVFLAAGLAWARDIPPDLAAPGRWLLGLALLAVVVAVAGTVFAMQVRTVQAPPLGDETADMVKDLLNAEPGDDQASRLAGFYADQASTWKDTNADMQRKNLWKAGWLRIAQFSLLVAAVLVAMLVLISVMA